MENVRNPNGRVVQRQVPYLGEVNGSQRAAWCRSIEVLCGEPDSKPMSLFPADREAPELEDEGRTQIQILREIGLMTFLSQSLCVAVWLA